MTNLCVFCKHFIGAGDWDLCCDLKHEGYPYGFLCYEDTEACDKFEEDYPAKRAFVAGFRHKDPIHEVYVVTVVEYINSDAAEPVNFIFDNEEAASGCFCFFAKQKEIGLFMEKEEVFSHFPSFLEGTDG